MLVAAFGVVGVIVAVIVLVDVEGVEGFAVVVELPIPEVVFSLKLIIDVETCVTVFDKLTLNRGFL